MTTTLKTKWLNPTRAKPEATEIEEKYKAKLLELCNNNLDTAQFIHDEHYITHQQPNSLWSQYNRVALGAALEGLPPFERNNVTFAVKFDYNG